MGKATHAAALPLLQVEVEFAAGSDVPMDIGHPIVDGRLQKPEHGLDGGEVLDAPPIALQAEDSLSLITPHFDLPSCLPALAWTRS